MTETPSGKKIEIALRLGLLSEEQIQVIEQKKAESNYPGIEVAVRSGYLNRSQLDLINTFSKPLDVVPGYRIDGLIGQGGAGVVFKATQLRMDRSVAIKTINHASINNDTTIKRFEREAQIVGNLRHPNIVSAFDFGLHNEKLYLVMEFVEGIDGEKYLSQTKIPEIHAWHVALQVCHALDYANQQGIIHRDIKPGNLILTTPPSGSQLPGQVPFVKIADFGLARFKDNPTSSSITMESGISGTPFYMSPEQVKGQDIDHYSDIYALGVTLWHMIAGYPPIGGSSPLDVITSKMKMEDSWMSDTPNEISSPGFELLKKMCRYEREQRIGDYGSLVKEIESVIHTLGQEDLKNTVDINSVTEQFSALTNVTFIGELGDFEYEEDSVHSPNAKSSHFDATIDLKRPRSQDPKSKRSPVLISLLTLLACLAAAYFLWFKPSVDPSPNINGNQLAGPNSGSDVDNPRQRLQKPNGPLIPLFDGFRVDPRGQGPGSKWESATDDDGGKILAGRGSKKFKCVDRDGNYLNYFRFSCGFLLHEAEQLEFVWLDSANTPEFNVVVLPESAKVMRGETLSGECTLPEMDPASFGYHQIQIESQPGYWRVAIGTEFVKNIPKPEGVDLDSTIQLIVTGGTGSAHFDNPRLVPFSS